LVIRVADSGEPYFKCSFRASIPKARDSGNLASGTADGARSGQRLAL